MAEDISQLLFALANADRLVLLSQIQTQKQRLTTLSKAINASAQECSRHLARLTDAGFIKKSSSGLYESTSVGRAVQSFLPGLRFLLTYRDNFLSHDLSFLPPTFVERIGELAGGQYVNHVSQVLRHIKTTIAEAKEYVWLIADRPIVTGATMGSSFQSRTVSVRLIAQQIDDPKELNDARPRLPEKMEIAMLPEVKVAMAINETIAGVCFPGLDGEIDFGVGFSGTDPRFRAWCSDLFDHYWSKSRKILFP